MISSKPLITDPIIEVRDLVKRYGDFAAVDGVSFAVPAGSIFGFLGPNGAGKTTIVKMLTTVLRPTGGSISINGYDPAHAQRRVRESFGIVFQDSSLDSELTALENLELHGVLYGVPSGIRRRRMGELLNLVELWDRRNAFVKTFSGGMKRRLEIARALLHEPPIIFLDEPTIGLDPQTRNHIWQYIQTLNTERHITVFFTTHYMDEADRVANEVAIIDRGKIVSRGSPDAIKAQVQAATLEDAFISLTGEAMRTEEGSSLDQMRALGKAWGRR
ncbi:MAG TPA: ATP-binding cassette domain-containing protein [Acidiferrobacter sp.]|nr:ATP-binding cassette domain-containing protein [Acidiferrobacter sp.]